MTSSPTPPDPSFVKRGQAVSEWPTDQEYRGIRQTAERALADICAGDGGSRSEMGAVNWSHLRVVEVSFCRDEHGDCHWRVLIEEASPGCGLGHAVYLRLSADHPNEFFDVVTEW